MISGVNLVRHHLRQRIGKEREGLSPDLGQKCGQKKEEDIFLFSAYSHNMNKSIIKGVWGGCSL